MSESEEEYVEYGDHAGLAAGYCELAQSMLVAAPKPVSAHPPRTYRGRPHGAWKPKSNPLENLVMALREITAELEMLERDPPPYPVPPPFGVDS